MPIVDDTTCGIASVRTLTPLGGTPLRTIEAAAGEVFRVERLLAFCCSSSFCASRSESLILPLRFAPLPFQRFSRHCLARWEEYDIMRTSSLSGIIPNLPFTSDNAYSMRQRWHGLHRAAFWRALGFPNLVLARAARQRNLACQRLEKAYSQAQRRAGLDAFLNSTRDDL